MDDDPESLFNHGIFIGSGANSNSYRFWESSEGFAVAGRSIGPRIRQSRDLLNAIRRVRRSRDDHIVSGTLEASLGSDEEEEDSGVPQPAIDQNSGIEASTGGEFQDRGRISRDTTRLEIAPLNRRVRSTGSRNVGDVIGRRRRQRVSTNIASTLCGMVDTLRESVRNLYVSTGLNSSLVRQVYSAHGIHCVINNKKLAVALSPYRSVAGRNEGRVVSVLLQTSSQPLRAACVSFRLSPNDGLQSSNPLFQRRCSCQQEIWNAAPVQCEHTDIICNSNLEDRLTSILFLTSQNDGRAPGAVFTDTRSLPISAEYRTFVYRILEPREDCAGRGFTRSRRRRRNFFIVFDFDSLMGLPLCQREGQRLQCFSCEYVHGSRNNCEHMIVCSSIIDACSGDTSESSESESDESGEELAPPPEYYKSFCNRRLFMCRSERSKLHNLLLSLSLPSTDQLSLSDPLETLQCAFLKNNGEQTHSVDISQTYERRTILHTLLHGDVIAIVSDYRCSCGELVWFDGLNAGIFSGSRDHLYTRDLVEAWLFAVCVNDTSFREAYSAVEHIRKSASAALVAERSVQTSLRPRYVTRIGRRAANDAFNSFLHCVNGTFHDGGHTTMLDKLHSCDQCEIEVPQEALHLDITNCDQGVNVQHEGPPTPQNITRKRFRGVVVDGTATGILSRLPPYTRHILEVRQIPNVPRRFVISENGRIRIQKDAVLRLISGSKKICTSCDVDGHCPNFQVLFKGRSYLEQRDFVEEILLPENEPVTDVASVNIVQRVLRSAFRFRIAPDPVCCMQERDDGRDIIVSHNMDRKLRPCMADIIQVALTDSLPGVFIEKGEDVPLFEQYAMKVRHITICQCGGLQAHQPSTVCLTGAHLSGTMLRYKFPALAEFIATVVSTLPNRSDGDRSSIMNLCVVVADILDYVVDVCSEFFNACQQNLPNSAMQLEQSLEREIGEDIWQGSVVTASELAALSPLETGCLFPGRQQCRPLIKFADLDTPMFCNKKYNTAKKHSPGLCTVQCVCKHPKIIGVIVMTHNETTALALSTVASFFEILPENMFYDNGCNLRRGIITRLAFLFRYFKVLIDRFHFKSHICATVFDPTAYPRLDYERTSTAESINAVLAETRKHVRFLRGSNLIPFLRARMAILNIISYLRSTRTLHDIEDQDLIGFFDSLITCSCGGSTCADHAIGQQGEDSTVSVGSTPSMGSNSVSTFSGEEDTDSASSTPEVNDG